MTTKIIVAIVLAYFLGAIPTGIIVSKGLKGVDVRDYGSGNSGATNVYRTFGLKYGLMTFVGDLLKGFTPVFIGASIGITQWPLVILGIISILAHTYSVFINFKGGKGVATSLGVFLFLNPIAILCALGVFTIVVWRTKYVGLGSVLAALALPIFTYFFGHTDLVNHYTLIGMTLIVSGFVIFRHRSNIKNLLNGTEKKFNEKVE